MSMEEVSQCFPVAAADIPVAFGKQHTFVSVPNIEFVRDLAVSFEGRYASVDMLTRALERTHINHWPLQVA